MYNRRVSKCHPRMEACGSLDELNAALGLARAQSQDESLRGELIATQRDLVVIMGELATETADYDRYAKDGFPLFKAEMTARLDGLVKQLESRKISFEGWATPGANLAAACLDLARTACRRAERRVCALHDAGDLLHPEILVYLNRLSDVLWLLARQAEGSAT